MKKMMFEKNESDVDRMVRAVLGACLVAVGYWSIDGWIKWLVMVIGVMLMITAITGFCSIYPLLGINTRKGRK